MKCDQFFWFAPDVFEFCCTEVSTEVLRTPKQSSTPVGTRTCTMLRNTINQWARGPDRIGS